MCQTDLEWQQIYMRLRRNRADAEAWQVLERRVRAWLRSDEPQAADLVDDAVAEVLASVYFTFERARGPRTFRGFVHGHRLNVRRRMWSKQRAPLLSLDLLDESFATVDTDTPGVDVEELHDALEELSPREREAITLRYFDNLPTDRLATTLGVTPVNARQIVFQALVHLRRSRALRDSRFPRAFAA
jgi:RNA polymerase sigma factor (sigma-70 family)